MIKAVIFDLDGTLADTARLTESQRSPWHVLAPGFHESRDWRWNPGASDLPGELISRGYVVAVATRAPFAYASTLLHLIGADMQAILASCGKGVAKASEITNFLQMIDVEPSEAIYVGDLSDDAAIARVAGTHYADVADILNGKLVRSLPMVRAVPPVGGIRSSIKPRFASGVYATDTGRVDAAAVSEAVAESIRAGIPDDDGLARSLNALFQHPNITREDRSALCYFSLLQHQGTRLRLFLQHGLFAGLHSSSGECVVKRAHGVFQVRSQLVTKSELRSDLDLRRRYLKGLNRAFVPAAGALRVADNAVPVRVIQTYRVGFGNILRETKQYGGTRGTRFRSGPEVQLGHLDLVADLVASALEEDTSVQLVVVPSSPATAQQPGEVSLRLGHAVANRTGRVVRPVLTRSGDSLGLDPSQRPGDVVLIDDQITQGNSIATAASLLVQAGFRVRSIVSYSANGSFLDRVGAAPHRPHPTCAFQQVAAWLGTKCLCGRVS